MNGQCQAAVSFFTPNNERGVLNVYNGIITLGIFSDKGKKRLGGIVINDEARVALIEIIRMTMNENTVPVKHFITVSKNNFQLKKREVSYVLGIVKADDGIYHFELRLNGQAFSLFFPKNQNTVIDTNTSSPVNASKNYLNILLQWLDIIAPYECSRTYEPVKRNNGTGSAPAAPNTPEEFPF